MCYLRRQLGDAARLDPAETVHGVGYRYRRGRWESVRLPAPIDLDFSPYSSRGVMRKIETTSAWWASGWAT